MDVVSIYPPLGRQEQRLVGRDKLIDELQLVLDNPRQQPRVRVLHGLGGVGKSSIALELARRNRGVPTWWITGIDYRRLHLGFEALARVVGAEGDIDPDVLWQRLADRRGRWLLIIDGADDPDMLAASGEPFRYGTGWVRPPNGHGLIVITSRDGNSAVWGPGVALHQVSTLPVDDAVEVLFDHVGDRAGTREEAVRLAHRLGGLPLALRLAGAYLASSAAVPDAFAGRERVTTFARYQQLLDRRIGDAGGDMPEQPLLAMVDQTWEVSLDLLQRRGLPLARPLLRLLALFADAPLPFDVLLDVATMAGSPPFPQLDGAALTFALRGLTDIGLVEVASSPTGPDVVHLLSLPRMVRDLNRHHGRDDIEAYLELAVNLLYRAGGGNVAGEPANPVTWPVWHTLAPHAFALFAAIAELPDPDQRLLERAADALIGAATSLYASNLYTAVESDLQSVLDSQRQILGEFHPETLTTRQHLAVLMDDRGDLIAAEAEYRILLNGRRRALGKHHPDTRETAEALERILARRKQVDR